MSNDIIGTIVLYSPLPVQRTSEELKDKGNVGTRSLAWKGSEWGASLFDCCKTMEKEELGCQYLW